MKPKSSQLTFSLLAAIAWLWLAPAARASNLADIALDFSVPEGNTQPPPESVTAPPAMPQSSNLTFGLDEVNPPPPHTPPHTPPQPQEEVPPPANDLLPPPPPTDGGVGKAIAPLLAEATKLQEAPLPVPALPPSSFSSQPEAVGGSSDEAPGSKSVPSTSDSKLDSTRVARIPDAWWQQGSDSPLAIALGAAEGTRQVDGDKNPAYYWHRDPGNGNDNFGTFSYQHLSVGEKAPVTAAGTEAAKRAIAEKLGLPDLADRHQLARLQGYYQELRQRALAKGMSLSLEELINGIDLANQSPKAAMNAMGYLDRLEQMRRLVDDPDRQIQEARTWSFWHPTQNRWAAPGLGNTYDSILRDQSRRFRAIRQALQHQ